MEHTRPDGAGSLDDARRWDARLGAMIAGSAHNLVSARDRARVSTVHLPEARLLAEELPCRPGDRWMDLGTGGGIPGLVLAHRHPTVRWTLVDSAGKKATAVGEFARALKLRNVEVVTARAETLAHDPAHRGGYDGVVARAVAPLVVLVELARGFVRADGWLVAVKGPGWREELAEAEEACRLLRWSRVTGTVLASAARPSTLVTMRADGPPPPGYPRRVGLPAKRPLRGRFT